MPPAPSRTVRECRVCGAGDLFRYLDLGRTPLANSYLDEAGLRKPEFSEELCLQLCTRCGLSQLTKVVDPDVLFRNYLYVSGTTRTIREHFGELAAASAKAADAEPGDLAIDVASNDGTLLQGFMDAGLKAVGVDPAENLAKEANAAGRTTVCDYWTPESAGRVAQEHGKARVITACNVFAHVDDVQGFVKGVAAALAPRGLFVIEAPYGVDFIEKSEFDTAYHEHLSYLSVTPVQELMNRHGFEVVDCEYFADIHGGTMRYFCARRGERPVSKRVEAALAREKAFGIKDPKVYEAFARRVQENKKALRELLAGENAKGRKVWAYGASAKGNTLMNFFELTSKDVPAAVDDNPKKWGLYTPGARMRIVGPRDLASGKPDAVLLLAWNFEKEIRARCAAAGYAGDFIVPVPQARLVKGGA